MEVDKQYPPTKTRIVVNFADEFGQEFIDSPYDIQSLLKNVTEGLSDFVWLKDVDGSVTLIKTSRILSIKFIPQEG